MHLHLPKPLHGWREFAGEVGVIVLGILIALGAGQVVESIHWNDQVRVARASMHREMAFDLSDFADRVRVAPCIDRHIAEAQKRIDYAAATGSTPPGPTNLQSPGRLIVAGDYEAQQSAGNLAHFPPEELSQLGVWYDQVRNFKAWDNVEGAAWTSLSLLAAGRTKLGQFDLALLRRDLQVAREMEVLSVLNSKRQIARARAMGVSAGPSRSDWVRLICHEGSS